MRITGKILIFRNHEPLERNEILAVESKYWSLPGGKSDTTDRDMVDTLLRELSEEVRNLEFTYSNRVFVPDYVAKTEVFHRDNILYLNFLFVGFYTGTLDPIPHGEIKKVQWMKFNDFLEVCPYWGGKLERLRDEIEYELEVYIKRTSSDPPYRGRAVQLNP